jgi:hypothetical protein
MISKSFKKQMVSEFYKQQLNINNVEEDKWDISTFINEKSRLLFKKNLNETSAIIYPDFSFYKYLFKYYFYLMIGDEIYNKNHIIDEYNDLIILFNMIKNDENDKIYNKYLEDIYD